MLPRFWLCIWNAGLSGVPKLFVAATLTGWTGVNLFFVLSGFLITGIPLDKKNTNDYYRRFYYRRALRILPIYYFVLALLAVLPRLGLIDRQASWSYLGLCLIYLANVTELFGVPMQYGVLWTLAVEEHFYLFWPMLVRALSRRSAVIAGTTVVLLCPILRWTYYWLGYNVGQSYTWLYADGLALGAILVALVRGTLGSRPAMWRLTLVLGVASLCLFAGGAHFGIFLASRGMGLVLRSTALNLFFAGGLTLTLLLGSRQWRAFATWKTLRFCGDISYGLYLIHMLVFDIVDHFTRILLPSMVAGSGHFGLMIVRFIVGAGMTTLIAYVSRWHFEEYFLKMKERPVWRHQ